MIITTQSTNSGSHKSVSRPGVLTAGISATSGKKAIIKSSLLYSGIFVLLLSLISIGYYHPQGGSKASVGSVASTESDPIAAATMDQKTATDVAANFAMQTEMPIAPNVANLSTSLQAKSEIAQTDDAVISKPQIVQPTADSRTVTSYKAKTGDTVQSIATQYKLSPQTIKWANNLASDNVENGRDIAIPPVDGVVYTAKDGDTAQSIAQKYSASSDRIVSFNDLEVDGVKKDMQLIIPGGTMPAEPAPATRTGRTTGQTSTSNVESYTGGVNFSMARASVGNSYAPGNCTWYAYERRAELGRPIGSFWGNASTWAMNGVAAGFAVNRTPAPGAIMQSGGGYAGYGHVAVVESLNPDGSITVSEMNYAGFNVVSSRTIPAGQVGSYSYIH